MRPQRRTPTPVRAERESAPGGALYRGSGRSLLLLAAELPGVDLAAGNGVNRDGGGIPYLALQAVDDVLLLGLGKFLPAVRHDPDFLDQSLQQALAERVGGHVHEVRVVAHREWVLFVGDPFQLLELGVAEVGVGAVALEVAAEVGQELLVPVRSGVELGRAE